MSSSEEKFKQFLEKLKIDFEIINFKKSTKTSQQAADVLGTDVSHIGKSIVFKTESNKFVLVIASGANRINEQVIESELNEKLIRPNPEEIRDYVGYPIGGIPPFGHDKPMIIFMDRDLFELDKIFCAGGTPNTIFSANPNEIADLAGAKVINVH